MIGFIPLSSEMEQAVHGEQKQLMIERNASFTRLTSCGLGGDDDIPDRIGVGTIGERQHIRGMPLASIPPGEIRDRSVIGKMNVNVTIPRSHDETLECATQMLQVTIL